MDPLAQLIESSSAEQLLMDVLFVLLGASMLALVGLCIGLMMNGAAYPLQKRLTELWNNWFVHLEARQRRQPAARSHEYRSLTRR